MLTVDIHIFNEVAQLGHFAGGLACVFGSIVLFGTRGRKTIAVSILIAVVLIAIKEFWYDVTFETPIVRGSDALDFSIYLVGMVAAFVAIWIRSNAGAVYVKVKAGAFIFGLALVVAAAATYYKARDIFGASMAERQS